MHLQQFVGLAVCFGVAGFLFFNAYYAYRFPEKYIKANWTLRRGLPREPNTAITARGRSPKQPKNGLQLIDSTLRFRAEMTITTG